MDNPVCLSLKRQSKQIKSSLFLLFYAEPYYKFTLFFALLYL